MDFKKQAIDAGGGGGAGEGWNETPISRCNSAPGGSLHGVSGVKDHPMTPVSHGDESAHIDHQIALSKGGAALRDPGAPAASFFQLLHDGVHRLRGEKLAFLHVDGSAGLGGGQEQVGLPAEKRGNLQDIHDLGGLARFAGRMDIR